MATSTDQMQTQPSTAAHRAAARWAALVDDVVVPMPRRTVTARLIKDQAGAEPGFVLVRDHNSPEDTIFRDEDPADLGQGNVFYLLRACDVQPRPPCQAPPKLAFFIDDRFEIATRPSQTGKTLRELFAIPSHTRLVRDSEGPTDVDVAPEAEVRFSDGPVFYTRATTPGLAITVNARVFGKADGVKPQMTGREIAALVYPEDPGNTRVWEVSAGNRELGLDERTTIEGCEVFDVVRCNVTGGFEASRVERELDQLRAGGLWVTLVDSPEPAVVYHALRGTLDGRQITTDVLVTIPSAYPGQFLDYAYLPEGSPLIGRVPGSPQGPRVQALGTTWQQISYHPHNGGGGPSWNPGRHGLHTYVGELLSWLRI